MTFRHSRSGFTLIELIVGMTVFAIGLTGILALLSNTMLNSKYSRHEIVVANILREQMELVKNIRDTNLMNYTEWDKVYIAGVSTSTWTGGIYIIENNFSHSEFIFDNSPVGIPGDIKYSPVYLEDITGGFPTDMASIFTRTQLYLDTYGRYTHLVSPTSTSYASYVIVSPLGYTGSTGFVPVKKDGRNQGYIIDARVIVKNGDIYREYDAKTAITDWVK